MIAPDGDHPYRVTRIRRILVTRVTADPLSDNLYPLSGYVYGLLR